MRRPINWVVVCISLLFLAANVSFPGRESDTPISQVIPDRPDPEFGYVREDGSFVPLAQPASKLTSASPSWR